MSRQTIQRWVTQDPKEVKQEGIPEGLSILAQEVQGALLLHARHQH